MQERQEAAAFIQENRFLVSWLPYKSSFTASPRLCVSAVQIKLEAEHQLCFIR